MAGRVVIVGAGPTGACLALTLCRSGVPTTLVEANRSFQRQFRGEALMPSGLSALQAMGLLPLLDRVPTRSLQGWRVVLNRQELFSVAEPPTGEQGPGCTLVSQPDLLQALVAACQEQPAFHWIQGQGASALLERQGRITGIRLSNGEHLDADLVVGCDGRSSLVRQRAGLELEAQAQPIDVLWMRLQAGAPPPLGGQFTTVVGAAGVFSAFESVHGGMQVGWVLAAGEQSPQLAPEAWLTRLASQSSPQLAAWLQGQGSCALPSLEGPVRLSVHCGLARRWWRPGLLLLGDAAHPMSPVRAQGINMALRDAWAAAASLTPLLQASATADRLDQALANLAERRRAEVAAVQRLQLQETRRGEALRQQPWLRGLVAGAAPWLGPVIGHRWQHQQMPLRHGITSDAAMMAF
jgi:2-polyprenyl-6-methoxyphenol hydroxylase-like FAD-dependent oxidoreductase